MSRGKNPSASRQSARSGARARIVKAAVDLVCKGGPGAATARAICEAAHITAPTLYHYFGDLYQLYDEVLQLMYIPEAQAFPGRELTDPRGMIEYMWDCCVETAKQRPGMVELKNQLIAMGKVPQSLNMFYARLVRAFEQLAVREPLNFPSRTAAAVYWSAAIGAALMIAASPHRDDPFPIDADRILRDSVWRAIVRSAAPPPAKARRDTAGLRPTRKRAATGAQRGSHATRA